MKAKLVNVLWPMYQNLNHAQIQELAERTEMSAHKIQRQSALSVCYEADEDASSVLYQT